MRRFIPYIIVAIVLLGGIVVAIVFAAIFGWLINLLYIFFMVLALLLILATALQVFSIFLLIRTIVMVRNEIKPVLESVQETVGIVQETAKTAGHTVSTIGTAAQFTNDLAVAPTVKAAAAVIAGQQMFRVFLGKGHVRSRTEQRRREQSEALAAAGGE
jgi:hypothetical protein